MALSRRSRHRASWTTLAAEPHLEWESRSSCSGCGRDEPACDDAEGAVGWRWYSNGRGGLWPLCAACVVLDPTLPLSQLTHLAQVVEVEPPEHDPV